MALIQLGGGVTDIRGSIGGTTYSRNAAGNYARRRVKPINPRSNTQDMTRAILSYLSNYWAKTLTEIQRTAWRMYAAATNFTNKLGQTIHINGMASFVRVNGLLLYTDQTLQAAAPVLTGHAGAMEFSFTADPTLDKLSIAEPSGSWVETDEDDRLYLWQSRPMSAGRLTSPSGWKFLSTIVGGIVPPTWPYEPDSLYPMEEDQQVAVKMIHQDAEGRVSSPTIQVMAAVSP